MQAPWERVGLVEIQSLTPGDESPVSAAPGDGKRPKAVRWLSPRQLLRTGREVAQAALFAKYADKREAEANTPRNAYDLGTPPGRAIWLDYVADTGDGFNATFAVACSVSGARNLVFDREDEQRGPESPGGCTFERHSPADLLVLGGDEVYPVASPRDYKERLNNVYVEALERATDPPSTAPSVVALPGNHDWYDGLVGFRRNFCESWVREDHVSDTDFLREVPSGDARDNVGGWAAFQSRSYFAVRLAFDWWLWGIDIQLDAPIDAEQLFYFREANKLLGERGNVILCTARPSWVDPVELDEMTLLSNRRALLWFTQRIFGADKRDRVRLMLSGDKHHYARYRATAHTPRDDQGVVAPTPDLVTCGGGGAFLSSTHHLDDTLTMTWDPKLAGGGPETSYVLEEVYPSKEISKRLLYSLFAKILPCNGKLWVFVGALYFTLLCTVGVGQEHAWWPSLAELHWPDTWEGLSSAWFMPFLLGVLLLKVLLVVYASYGSKGSGWIVAALLGGAHAVAHLAGVLGTGLLVGLMFSDLYWLIVDAIAFALCAVVGTMMLAGYLLVADRLGFHETDSFSAMRIEDYKCHLRIHVTQTELHVHAVGFDDVPDLVASVDAPVTARQIDYFTVRTKEAEAGPRSHDTAGPAV